MRLSTQPAEMVPLQPLLAAILSVAASAGSSYCSDVQQLCFLPGLPGSTSTGREAQAPSISVVA